MKYGFSDIVSIVHHYKDYVFNTKNTLILSINRKIIDPVKIEQAAKMLAKGKLVVFPTETVYGLGANALDAKACEAISEAKGRPSDNPLIVHITDYNMLHNIVSHIPRRAIKLMDAFWPGPLTIVFKKKKIIPDKVTGNLDTVAVRMPVHPIAHELIRVSKVPVAAPSANLSGKPSPTTARHVIDDLSGRVDCIIDGGNADLGLESTVVDVSEKGKSVLLRPGGISREQIEKVIGKVILASPSAKVPRSPGMKYRHYAPKTPFILAIGASEKEMRKKISIFVNQVKKEGKKVVVICSQEFAREIGRVNYDLCVVGSRKDLSILAACIFRVLRDLDTKGYDYLVMGSCHTDGIGLAIMNRVKKAASKIL